MASNARLFLLCRFDRFDVFKANHYLAYGKQLTDEEIDYYKRNEGYPPIVLGLCTDSRNPKRTYLDAKNELMRTADYESQYCYFNLFTVGCIKVNGQLTTSVEELVDAVEELVNERQ